MALFHIFTILNSSISIQQIVFQGIERKEIQTWGAVAKYEGRIACKMSWNGKGKDRSRCKNLFNNSYFLVFIKYSFGFVASSDLFVWKALLGEKNDNFLRHVARLLFHVWLIRLSPREKNHLSDLKVKWFLV